MSTVILKSEHHEIMRKIKRRARMIYLLLISIILFLIAVPWAYRIERDLVFEAYNLAKREFNIILAKQELINLLRSKPLTVGQALDITDIIISQRNIPIPLVLGIISHESEFKPEVISDKGARGIMQVMPLIFRTYVHSPILENKRQMHDPVTNIRVGLSYLMELKQKYKNWEKILRVYQAGEQNIDNKKYDWYVRAVLKKMEQYEKVWRQ